MKTYQVQYSGTYEDGEDFSDAAGSYTRKSDAVKAVNEMRSLKDLRGPDGQKIAKISVYVIELGSKSMVYG